MNDKRYGSELFWGVPLIVLGVLFLLNNFFGLGHFFGVLIPGAIGAAFLYVFYYDRRHWWAIIPGGILVSSAFSGLVGYGWGRGSLQTIGVGLTFLAVWYFTGPENRQRWAIWPGGILFVIGVLQLLSALAVWGVIWPLILIGIGVYSLTRRRP